MKMVLIGILSFIGICFFAFVLARIITLSVLTTKDRYEKEKLNELR